MLFVKQYPHIFKIKSKSGDIIPFRLNKIQKIIMGKIERDLKKKGRSRLIIVKGRQGGVTTLFQLLGLSYAMSEKGINCYTMAQDGFTATDIFDDKVKFAFDNLPPYLKSLYSTKKDNVRQLMFDGGMQKAKITVGTGARGTTQNFLHISEAGKMSEKQKVWNEMVSGTLQASKQAKIIAIESTADNGLSSFYEMVMKAKEGKNEFDVLFISWTLTDEYVAKPPRNDNWLKEYESLAKLYKLHLDPIKEFGISKKQFYWYYLTAQELKEDVKVQYPFTLDEAFVSKSRTKFDIQTIRDRMQAVKKPIAINNDIKIFYNPSNEKYVLSIDPASGLGADYTGIKIRWNDGARFRELASFKGKLSEQETAVIVVNLAKWINKTGQCLIMPETNMGSYLIDYIRRNYDEDFIYKRYVADPTKPMEPKRADYGWKTTAQNRDLMINKYAEMWIDGLVEINDEDQYKEMEKFVWNDDKMRYEAQNPFHDDLLFADFINLQGFKYLAEN